MFALFDWPTLTYPTLTSDDLILQSSWCAKQILPISTIIAQRLTWALMKPKNYLYALMLVYPLLRTTQPMTSRDDGIADNLVQ
jgi:hypothetical protein